MAGAQGARLAGREMCAPIWRAMHETSRWCSLHLDCTRLCAAWRQEGLGRSGEESPLELGSRKRDARSRVRVEPRKKKKKHRARTERRLVLGEGSLDKNITVKRIGSTAVSFADNEFSLSPQNLIKTFRPKRTRKKKTGRDEQRRSKTNVLERKHTEGCE